jgi:hypothetical protein
VKKFLAAILAVTCFSFVVSLSGKEVDNRLQKLVRSIQPMSAYNLCRTLAGPEFAGRFTGEPGYKAAAKWAADKFSQWGLKPVFPGFLQSYPSPHSLIRRAELTLFLPAAESGADAKSATTNEKGIRLEPIKEFMPLLFSDSGQRSGELVFAGWGICAPELGYDDYAGLDVKGKYVLCFRGTPDEEDRRFQAHDEHRARLSTARDKGAIGLVYIYEEVNAHPNGDRLEGFLPAMISESVADKIFQERGVKCADLRKDLETYKKPLSFPLHARIDLLVESEFFPKAQGYNIAGSIEGSDPAKKDECVILGGHFDGCGQHMGILFPGADDNASGSAVIMEIARAASQAGIRPKRSLLFVLFGGEEMGLQGSNWFAAHLPPLGKRAVAMLNFDMEGEGEKTFAIYSANLPDGKALLEKADSLVKTLGGSRVMQAPGVRGSDFAPFYHQGVPCAAFFSDGPHLHYHLPGDTIYRINPDILADVAKLAFVYSFFIADR